MPHKIIVHILKSKSNIAIKNRKKKKRSIQHRTRLSHITCTKAEKSTFSIERLNAFRELKSTVSYGRLFQTLTIQILKKLFLGPPLQRCLNSLYGWPRVTFEGLITKKSLNFKQQSPKTIL